MEKNKSIFRERVIDVVKKIPKGKVLTYGEVAKYAGNEKASRVVGSIMAKNIDKTVPCHRVVKSDGSIGEYNGLQGISKKSLLKNEGVVFIHESKVSVK
jgi:O-6-methylguanine DNA methyltransferase